MSDRVKFITHQDINIVLIDYSGLREPEYFQVVGESEKFILNSGKKDLRILIDLSGSIVTREVSRAQAQATKKTKHLIKKVAVVGLDPLKRIMANTVMAVVNQETTLLAKTMEDAKRWLSDSR